MTSDGFSLEMKGTPASPGLAVGRVCFWNDPETIPRYTIQPDQVKEELTRFDEALSASRKQLQQLHQRVQKELGDEEAAIFSSHGLLLDDPSFYARVEKKLITESLNLEAAVESVVEEMARIFLKIPDPYLRERADDYRDVGRRVLENLLSYQRKCTIEGGELIVLVAHDLMPSDTVHFRREHIGAFVTERGGVSSHAAILARSLQIPAVVGVPHALSRIRAGALVLVDGTTGRILTDPDEKLAAEAKAENETRNQASRLKRPLLQATTADGVPVTLSANLTRELEAEEARMVGAQGVGLLRTEFLFMDHGEFLDEEGQYQAYRHVVENMAPHRVTIRTLDLGEDKRFDFESPVDSGKECVLGWRSIRISLAYQTTFSAQLRALLRAALHGPLRILLPMVTGVEEIRQVRTLLLQADEELTRQGIPHASRVELGAMIETPASAILPEIILAECDFLSIGTNDLVQYLMVADRTSERLQSYYRASAPVVLSLLKRLADVATRARKDISICGEIAGDPFYLPLLLGLGYRSLSVAPVLLPDLALTIGQLRLPDCESLARRCLALATADEVDAAVREAALKPKAA